MISPESDYFHFLEGWMRKFEFHDTPDGRGTLFHDGYVATVANNGGRYEPSVKDFMDDTSPEVVIGSYSDPTFARVMVAHWFSDLPLVSRDPSARSAVSGE